MYNIFQTELLTPLSEWIKHCNLFLGSRDELDIYILHM